MKYSYSCGGNNSGKGQGKMGGFPGAYISNMGPKPSGSAEKKGKNGHTSMGGTRSGMGSKKQQYSLNKKGYTGHSGMMRMGNND